MNRDTPTNEIQEPGKPGQRLLVAMAPGQISEPLVRWTQSLARSLGCAWDAVYVETASNLSEEDQLQVSGTLALARALGAEVITVSDPDFVRGLLRTALERKATQIVIGKKADASYWSLFRSDKWLARLLRESRELDIHVVRFLEESPAKVSPFPAQPYGSTWREYLIAVGIILAAAWVLIHIKSLIGYHGVAWIFLAVVVIMASFVGRGATLLAALLSALLWDYLFTEPLYSFTIAGGEDQILFVVYMVVAVVLGQLTTRIRRQERAERERKDRAEALQRLTREVTEAAEFDGMVDRAARQTAAVFKAPVALLLPSSTGLLSLHPAGTFQVPETERALAAWVYEHRQPAGRFTVQFPTASALYLPLAAYGDNWGVLGLQLNESFPPTIHQRNLLEAFAEQIGLAIHRHQMHQISEKSKVLAESERLSKTLLNSISHEVRTPLAAIQSATAFMVEAQKPELSDSQKAMMAEIQEATERLNRLVGRVLDITRLESGHVKPKIEPCEVTDLVQMAEDQTRKELAQHKVTIEIAPDLPPVAMDFELMLHSLANLLSNAAFHTPPGTEVQLVAKMEDGALLLIVADGGPGIPSECLPHLFEKFYRAPAARTGGTGLGLSIVKGFVEAQGGRVTAENRATGGAAFAIRLPLQQTAASVVETNSSAMSPTEKEPG
jgi:two-component system sensor histidine kinase KdpD